MVPSFGISKVYILVICISLSVAQTTTTTCQNNELSCQDFRTGAVCYNPNTTSCQRDIATELSVLCGFGLSSCKGVCFNPLINNCNISSGLQINWSQELPSSPLQSKLNELLSGSSAQKDEESTSVKVTATKITYSPPRIPINHPVRPTVTESL